MNNEKHRLFGKKEIIKTEEDKIIKEIMKIQNEMRVTRNNLNLVTDECLIDSYIYELTSLNKRYQYFLRQAKQHGITAFKMEG